jgi:protein gp37
LLLLDVSIITLNPKVIRVTDIRDQCLRAKVPFFFKQWGGVQKKRAGRTLEGQTWDEMPVRMNLVKSQF